MKTEFHVAGNRPERAIQITTCSITHLVLKQELKHVIIIDRDQIDAFCKAFNQATDALEAAQPKAPALAAEEGTI